MTDPNIRLKKLATCPTGSVNEQEKAATPELHNRPGPIIELAKMNVSQRAAFNNIMNHYLNASNNQLIMMITG